MRLEETRALEPLERTARWDDEEVSDEEAPVEPKELYQKLRPFGDLVADDIEGSADVGGDRR